MHDGRHLVYLCSAPFTFRPWTCEIKNSCSSPVTPCALAQICSSLPSLSLDSDFIHSFSSCHTSLSVFSSLFSKHTCFTTSELFLHFVPLSLHPSPLHILHMHVCWNMCSAGFKCAFQHVGLCINTFRDVHELIVLYEHVHILCVLRFKFSVFVPIIIF